MSFANVVGDMVAATARILVAPLGRRRSAKALGRLSASAAPTVPVDTAHGRILFKCPNEESTRVPTRFLSWEPETLAWIDDQIAPGSCLWDIGAHIGSFSIYAGAKLAGSGGQVLSFEPSAATFAVLTENIRINALSSTVKAYCLALSDSTRAGEFHISTAGAAQDKNAFGEPVNLDGRFEPAYSQAMLSFSVDELIAQFKLRPPDFVKLDVDSIELDILRGARQTLAGARGLLIEVESARSAEWAAQIEALLGEIGFRADSSGSARNRVFLNPTPKR